MTKRASTAPACVPYLEIMPAVETALALGVARLAMRVGAVALGLGDGTFTGAAVLDRLADLAGDALGVTPSQTDENPVERIVVAIGQRVAQRLAGLPDSALRTDLNSVALEVGGLFTRLSNDDAAIDASDATAFASWVASHGGRTVRLYAPQSAESLSDDCVRIGCEAFFEIRSKLPGFARAALVAVLGRTREIPALVAKVDHLAEVVDAVAALIRERDAEASFEELEEYLSKRLADWDALTWVEQGRAPSIIERRMRVIDNTDTRNAIPAEEAVAGSRVLTVLGGPGSGKTWQARRYARTAAERALQQLRAGAGLDQLELPVLTTWGAWSRFAGPAEATLIEASFDARLGVTAMTDPRSPERLRRTFGRAQHLLVVVDSLDEASGDHDSGRLVSLLGLGNAWTVVVTSRHGAWEALARPARADPRLKVVELVGLDYYDDVVPFVRSWFDQAPERAAALEEQIQTRHDLRDNATVPLLLAFYCVLASERQVGEALPSRRRTLYDQIARRLLKGAWNSQQPPDDVDECLRLLGHWAWAAVKDANAPSGLGRWADEFEQPGPQPSAALGRALDNVAPVTHIDDAARTHRAFRHRTLLEHFVAEHIATLPTTDALEALLPHLWFDTDWHTAAPGALVAHNLRAPSGLLRALLRCRDTWLDDTERSGAHEEYRRLLLRVAVESEPQDWSADVRAQLDESRSRPVSGELPLALARQSRHWLDSNKQAVKAVRTAITTNPHPFVVGPLVRALVDLATTDETRHDAIAAVRTAITTNPDPFVVHDLARVLVDLATTDETRHDAIAAVRTAITTNPHPLVVQVLARALVDLATTDETRHDAIAAVRTAITTNPDPLVVEDLARALVDLATDAESRPEASGVLRAQLAQQPGLAAELRAVSTSPEWIGWLNGEASVLLTSSQG